MANMTSQTDKGAESRERQENPQGEVSAIDRVAAGASTLTNQQLRRARERVDQQIESQRDRVTGRVRTLSRALRGAGEMLEDDDLVAQCLHFASDKAETVAGYVADLSPTRAADDLRSVARDRPALFFGGAFVLGLALGRFARSTAGALASAEEDSGSPRAPRTQTGARTRMAANRPANTNERGQNYEPRGGALKP